LAQPPIASTEFAWPRAPPVLVPDPCGCVDWLCGARGTP
jgi:hypothetical protein